MSQEKVNRYKEDKKNRIKNIAKEKRVRKVKTFVGTIVALAATGWLIWGAVTLIKSGNEEATAGQTLSQEELESLLNEIYSATTTVEGNTTSEGATTAEGNTTSEGETTAEDETTSQTEQEEPEAAQ